ncbi:MAG TPA: hypothetical protein VGJ88_04485 [Thermoanaerobaculia bacterium]|jgi:hypothetical protein
MTDIQKAFDELPASLRDVRDAETARTIWLRARMIAIVEDDAGARRVGRLRFASAAVFVAALDAIALLVIVSTVMTR